VLCKSTRLCSRNELGRQRERKKKKGNNFVKTLFYDGETQLMSAYVLIVYKIENSLEPRNYG